MFLLNKYIKKGGLFMPDYEEMYFALFNKITEIIEELKEIQCGMEEKYINDNNKEESNQEN